jgi:hypothetical protein
MLLGCASMAAAQETPAPAPAAPTEAAAAAPATCACAGQQGRNRDPRPHGAADGSVRLHVWPAERMNSITTGWLGAPGSMRQSTPTANSSNKTMMASALDSPSQLDALLSLDLRGLLKLSPGTTIITHATPIERKSMNAVKTRRSDSKAKCYSELIVADLFYQKAAIYGRSLKTLFMVRDFDQDDKMQTSSTRPGRWLEVVPAEGRRRRPRRARRAGWRVQEELQRNMPRTRPRRPARLKSSE